MVVFSTVATWQIYLYCGKAGSPFLWQSVCVCRFLSSWIFVCLNPVCVLNLHACCVVSVCVRLCPSLCVVKMSSFCVPVCSEGMAQTYNSISRNLWLWPKSWSCKQSAWLQCSPADVMALRQNTIKVKELRQMTQHHLVRSIIKKICVWRECLKKNTKKTWILVVGHFTCFWMLLLLGKLL